MKFRQYTKWLPLTFLITAFSSLFFLAIPPVKAIGCSGVIHDQNNKGVNGAQISCSGNSGCKLTSYNPVSGQYSYSITGPASDPNASPGFPYVVTITLPGYQSQTVTIASNSQNNGCLGSVTMQQNQQVNGWGCVNHACTFGSGSYPTQADCNTQCAAPTEAWCCKSIHGVNQCSNSGCFLSETNYVSQNACRIDCKQPTPTPAIKFPDLCPDSAPYYSAIAHGCCTNKQEGADANLGICHGKTDPIGCRASKTTTYKFTAGTNGSYGTCTPEGKTPVYICEADSKCATAIGDISTDPSGFINSLLRYALPAAILITLLTLLYVGYSVLTSRGNPEKLQASKELAVSIFTGLLLLIFSFAILQIIGVGILGINK